MALTLDEFNAFCSSLRGTRKVVQWGGSHVWKVGGKIFAICAPWGEPTGVNTMKIAFKCSDLGYQVLIEQPGIVPSPYLARAKWVKLDDPNALSKHAVCGYLENAHGIIASKLSKAKQRELGLLAD